MQRLLLATFSALIAAAAMSGAMSGAAHAQPLTLLGEQTDQRGTGNPAAATPRDASPGSVPTPVPSARAETERERILRKLKAGELLTEREFVVYLRMVEFANEKYGWPHLATQLHQWYYSADATLKFGVPLFVNGPENEGWEKVTLLTTPPKYITSDAREKVDIAHSYAGVRALVERNFVSGTLMGHINTGWGDSVQVAGGRITGAWTWIKGAVTLDPRQRGAGSNEFSNAANFKPRDQALGNEIGMKVQALLRSNRKLRLSEAYAKVLGE